MYIENVPATSQLKGFTLQGGSDNEVGGGILCVTSSLTVKDCVFQNNSTYNDAGGLYDCAGQTAVVGCTFLNNFAPWSGGAIYTNNSNTTITDCHFENNTAWVWGGAVTHLGLSTPQVTRCTFTQNNAYYGGAIVNYYSYGGVDQCTFVENSSVEGGAIWSYGVGGLFSNSLFKNNFADLRGGAIHCQADPIVANCILVGNTSNGRGGAVSCIFGTYMRLNNCTLVENSASEGSASSAEFNSYFVVLNSILWNNPGTDLAQFDDSSFVVVSSLLEDGFTGDGNISGNPLFVNETGGDIRLAAGSPCIDAGVYNYLNDYVIGDFAGNPRVTGSAIDMGAYEALAAPADLIQDLKGAVAALVQGGVMLPADGNSLQVKLNRALQLLASGDTAGA